MHLTFRINTEVGGGVCRLHWAPPFSPPAGTNAEHAAYCQGIGICPTQALARGHQRTLVPRHVLFQKVGDSPVYLDQKSGWKLQGPSQSRRARGLGNSQHPSLPGYITVP